MLAKTWLTLGTLSLLSVTTAVAAVSHSWHVRQRHSAQARYFWERGRCYRVVIENGGSVTRSQIDAPECINIPVALSKPSQLPL